MALIALFAVLVLLLGSILGIAGYLRIGRLASEVATLDSEVRKLRTLVERRVSGDEVAPADHVEGTASPASTDAAPDVEEPAEDRVASPNIHQPWSPQPETEISPLPADAPPKRPAIAARAAAATDSVRTTVQESTPGTATLADPTAAPRRGMLDELGARWSVWVGGIALGLGAIFLLRYSIEAGFFGPAMRVGVAVVFGALLLGAGEWLRRIETSDRQEFLKHAYIPGVLTAVGILTLLGAVYVSYAVYEFIGAAPAFVLLGLISLSALALGLVQGPGVSGLGLVGSLITPALVSTSSGSFPALYTYLAVVAAATMSLGRVRNWPGMTLSGAAGPLIWAVIGMGTHRADRLVLWLIFLGAIFGLALLFGTIKTNPATGRDKAQADDTWLPILTYAAIAALLATMMVIDGSSARVLIACIGGTVIGLCVAWYWRSLAWIAACAGALSVVVFSMRAVKVVGAALPIHLRGLPIPEPFQGEWAYLFYLACSISALFLMLAALAMRRIPASPSREAEVYSRMWSIAGGLGPMAILVPLWLIGTRGESHYPYGIAGFGFAVALVAVAEWFRKTIGDKADTNEPLSGNEAFAANIFYGSACAAVAYALFSGIDGLPLVAALSVAVILVALSLRYRPVFALRGAGVVFALLLLARSLYDVGADPSAVGKTAILNALWVYFALPAAVCLAASRLLVRIRVDVISQSMEAISLCFAALFAIFQVRHYMNDGDMFAPSLTLEELSMQVLVGLSFSLGLSRIRDVRTGGVFTKAAMLAMGISLINLLPGSLLVLNPLLNDDSPVKGGLVLNTLFLAYLLPGAFLAAIAWFQQDRRPPWYIRILLTASLLLLFVYVTAMVRLWSHSASEMVLYRHGIGDGEIYAYTIVWFLYGMAVERLLRLSGRVAASLMEPLRLTLLKGSATVLGVAGLNMAVGNLVTANPMLSYDTVVTGGAVLNSLLTAFLLPGFLAGLAAAVCRFEPALDTGLIRKLLGGIALISVLAYCTAVVRLIYAGPMKMSVLAHPIAHSEQYAYSIVWLVFAILLLAAAFVFKRVELRIASAAVMVLAVAKVFIVDMSALEGVLRALSFVGLGIVLLAVGYVYQRLLTQPDEAMES